MLCPEVWNFKSPSNELTVHSGLQSSLDDCNNLISQHYFNHNVSVVLPGCQKIPEDLIKELKIDCDYYKVNLPLSQLIERKFIDLFVKTGELSALSIGTRIDVDDCACVTPCGMLVLSLVRETYQKLGIEGKPWENSSNNPERYAVHIDLKKDCFKPGKPNYDRIYRSLSQFVPLQFEFIMVWEPPTTKGICPSSLASYLHNIKGYDVRLCEPMFSYKIERNVLVPPLMSTEPEELIEWLGAFSLGILKKDSDIADSSSEYLSSYQPPSDCEKVSQVVMLQWTGYFIHKRISQLFSKLCDYKLPEGDARMPWLSLNVNGFSDSPVSWGLKNHSFHTSGDNHYTVFVSPQKELITFQITAGKLKDNKRRAWVHIKQKPNIEALVS